MSQIHEFPIRVYYAETDAGGVVYHASYLNYMERARTEMMRDHGFDHANTTAVTDEAFVAVDVNLQYRAPARLDDELVVETSVIQLGGASVKIRQNIRKRLAEGDLLLLEGSITLVHVSLKEFKALRIPNAMRDALHLYLPTKEETL